jgi:Leucine-rich repeat (LRR) protein
MTAPQHKLRWFQFSLLSLLVLVTLCAIPCSFLSVFLRQVEKRQAEWEKQRAQAELAKPIQDLGGVVHFKPQCVPNGDYVDLANSQVSDATLAHIKWWPEIKVLLLDETQITDAGLECLKELTQLQELDLKGTRVTDAGLAHLEGLAQLRWLDLDGTRITDAGLEHLKGLEQLDDLWLNNTKVSDAGVKRLKQALPKCKIVR